MMDAPAFDGDLVLRSHHDPFGCVTGVDIVQADPRVRINRMILDSTLPDWAEWDGHLLKVHGHDRSVIYRVVGEDERGYLAEWPD